MALVSSSLLPDSILSTAQTLLDVSNSLVTAELNVNDLQCTDVNVTKLNVNVLHADTVIANTIQATEINTVDLNVQDINGIPYQQYKGLSGIFFLTINYDTDQSLFVILSKTGAILGTEPDIGSAVNTATTFLTVGRTYNQTIKVQAGRYALTTTIEMVDYMTLDLTEVELYSVDDALARMVNFDTITRAKLKGGTLNAINSNFNTRVIRFEASTFCTLDGVKALYGDGVVSGGSDQLTIKNCKFDFSYVSISTSNEFHMRNCAFVFSTGINFFIVNDRMIISDCVFSESTITYGIEVDNCTHSVLSNSNIYKNPYAGIISNTCDDLNFLNFYIIDNAQILPTNGFFFNILTHGAIVNSSGYNTLGMPATQFGMSFFNCVNTLYAGGTYHDNLGGYQITFFGGAGNVSGTNITVQP
jgi:hypothetical protein